MGGAADRWFMGLGSNDPQTGDARAMISSDHKPALLEPTQGPGKGRVTGSRLGIRLPEELDADAPRCLVELPQVREDHLLQPAQPSHRMQRRAGFGRNRLQDDLGFLAAASRANNKSFKILVGSSRAVAAGTPNSARQLDVALEERLGHGNTRWRFDRWGVSG